jgi:hypothetical protein
MIKQFLERGFMLKSADTLKQTMESNIAEAGTSASLKAAMEENEVEKRDLEIARQELADAITREAARPPAKEDKVSFFPRDPVLSIVQSSLQQYCEERKANHIIDKSTEIRAARQGEIPVANRELDNELTELFAPTQGKLLNAFEKLDVGWANCTLAAGIRRWQGRYPFNDQPATPYTIGNNARVILLSDWGSGLARAQKVAEAIRKELLDPKAAQRDKHVIHLGDVYYSGWAKEYESNFLPYWPVREGEADKYSSWTLNANHDMYSGGKGYFDYLLGDARFKAQEHSSFFSLENDNWLLLGLDTGYHQNTFDPHDLYGEQHTWAHKRLANTDKTGILLSHHQPFSAFEKGGEKILAKLQAPLLAKLVRGWFWGHEHRCTFYESRENIQYPRCIGHGGIPFYVEDNPLPAADGVIYEYREGFDDLFESWNYFGFVVLDFEDDTIKARYINERGTQHKDETLTRAGSD